MRINIIKKKELQLNNIAHNRSCAMCIYNHVNKYTTFIVGIKNKKR